MLSRYDPLARIPFRRVEFDPDPEGGLAFSGIWQQVALLVDLGQGFFRSALQFEFEHIDEIPA